jgi:hypothetical protein
MRKPMEKFEKSYELYFHANQESGIDISDSVTGRVPTEPGWYRIGTYPFEIALDLAHLYLQIPFYVRKKLGRIQIGEIYYGK